LEGWDVRGYLEGASITNESCAVGYHQCCDINAGCDTNNKLCGGTLILTRL
jgi:hypothetical protein